MGSHQLSLIEQISRQRAMYCVSTLAQAGALAALDDEAHIRKAVENNTEQSKEMVQEIRALGYSVTETWANFLYCELGRSVAELAERLRVEDIAVRRWSNGERRRRSASRSEHPNRIDVLLRALRKVRNS